MLFILVLLVLLLALFHFGHELRDTLMRVLFYHRLPRAGEEPAREWARIWAYRLLAPGVVLHESAHALVALLVGLPVTKISFFSPEWDPKTKRWLLGGVTHGSAKDPWRNLLVGVAPLIAGPLALVALMWIAGGTFPTELDPRELALSLWRTFTGAGLWAPILLYAFANLGTTVLLSREDLRDLVPAVVLGVPLILAVWFVADASLVGRLLDALRVFAGWVIYLMAGMLAADLLALLPLKVLERVVRPRGPVAKELTPSKAVTPSLVE